MMSLLQTAPSDARAAASVAAMDAEPRGWLTGLRDEGATRDDAIDRLHDLHLRGDDFEDLAAQSANDALLAVLGKLDDFHGDSGFTTWAHKLALLEAAVKIRRRTWRQREPPLEQDASELIATERASPATEAQSGELFAAIAEGGTAADAKIPGLRAHLQGCPACHEDHLSLRTLVADG